MADQEGPVGFQGRKGGYFYWGQGNQELGDNRRSALWQKDSLTLYVFIYLFCVYIFIAAF